MRRVSHLLLGLGKGGAETMLCEVLKNQQSQEIEYQVISFGAAHYYEDTIRSIGVPLICFNIKRRPIKAIVGTIRLLKKADVLCCWMYKANLIGFILGKIARVKKIVWCIRHSDLSSQNNKRSILFASRLCSKWSKKVDLIAYNGFQAKQVHEAQGYDTSKGTIIDNGCDCEQYSFNPEARQRIRNDFGISDDTKIILSVSRYAPIKDIPTFVKAIKAIKEVRHDVVAFICGTGLVDQNTELTEMITKEGLSIGKDIYLLGLRNDVPALLSACDLYLLHSAGEAFPNSLLQAMSCGCMCVSTKVGEVRRMLTCNAFLAEPADPFDIATKCNNLLCLDENEKQAIRTNNRMRAMQFDIKKIVAEYEQMW